MDPDLALSRITFAILALALFLGLPLPSAAQESLRAPWHDATLVEDFAFGVFCIPEHGSGREEAPGVETGYVAIHDDEPRLIRNIQNVPRVDGINFGIRARAKYAGKVNIIVEHPPRYNPTTTRQTWDYNVGYNKALWAAGRMDVTDGAPDGLWVFRAKLNGQDAIRVEFTFANVESLEARPTDPCRNLAAS